MQPTLEDLQALARGAGQILRAGYEGDHQVDYKGVIDLVTEVDHQSEAYLLEAIQRHFPGQHILAEESGELEGSEAGTWYIDPLDGTVNYAHGVPLFAVSIAFASRGAPDLGVVYDPLRDELFSARRGHGAWLNGRQLRVSSATELGRSLLVTGFPYDTWNSPRNNFDYFARLGKMTQGVRRLGSAALDLCYVAAGRFDGYWELSLMPWDVAAGGLIAEEAGALVTDVDGGPNDLSAKPSVLAATPALHPKILAALQESGSPRI
ncbi:MAG: inositol monophosphatase [Anaerolineales bacterium]|nr:inositol monophosphatase [Anaerolineales bacterium]